MKGCTHTPETLSHSKPLKVTKQCENNLNYKSFEKNQKANTISQFFKHKELKDKTVSIAKINKTTLECVKNTCNYYFKIYTQVFWDILWPFCTDMETSQDLFSEAKGTINKQGIVLLKFLRLIE